MHWLIFIGLRLKRRPSLEPLGSTRLTTCSEIGVKKSIDYWSEMVVLGQLTGGQKSEAGVASQPTVALTPEPAPNWTRQRRGLARASFFFGTGEGNTKLQ